MSALISTLIGIGAGVAIHYAILRFTRFCKPGTDVIWRDYSGTYDVRGKYIRKSSLLHHRVVITSDPELPSWVGREITLDHRNDLRVVGA